MVRRLVAESFLGRAESGRSHPMRCICVDATGNEIDVYVKYCGFHEELVVNHLTAELIANQLARDVGLPACEPVIVELSSEFIDALEGHGADELKEILPSNDVVAFGSVAAPSVRRWSNENLLHKAQKLAGLGLYCFDTIIENTDRGIGNNNLLLSGDDLVVIDFGHSFQRFTSADPDDFGPRPWQNGGIGNHFPGSLQHAMFTQLRPLNTDHLETTLENWITLSDGAINDYVTSVPNEWETGCADRIAEYILEARREIQRFDEQVRRAFQ